MFILDSKLAIGKGYKVVNRVENNVFANSLIGTIIQDSDKKKRSNGYCYLTSIYFLFILCNLTANTFNSSRPISKQIYFKK